MNIREMRKAKNLTQEQLANAIGISRENISRYESGERMPPTSRMIAIARFLGCSLDALAGTEDILPRTEGQHYGDI